MVDLESISHVTPEDGRALDVRWCNVFEPKHGKIKRRDSFDARFKDSP